MREMPSEKAEPTRPEIEQMLDDEDRGVLDELELPDEVKSEILQGLERRHEADTEEASPDEAPSA